MKRNDQRAAAYYAALMSGEALKKKHPDHAHEIGKPNHTAFGLTAEEAADIEKNGADTSCLPAHLRSYENFAAAPGSN